MGWDSVVKIVPGESIYRGISMGRGTKFITQNGDELGGVVDADIRIRADDVVRATVTIYPYVDDVTALVDVADCAERTLRALCEKTGAAYDALLVELVQRSKLMKTRKREEVAAWAQFATNVQRARRMLADWKQRKEVGGRR